MNNKKICVVGLGYIGLPTSLILCDHGFTVHGVDVNKDLIKNLENGITEIEEEGINHLLNRSIKNGLFSVSAKPKESDIYVIAVPTPFMKDYEPDLRYVKTALKGISKLIKKNDLIIIESTIPVNTTKKMYSYLLELGLKKDSFYMSHCPERVIPGNLLNEIVHNDRIVGGLDSVSTELTASFYKSFVKGEVLKTDAKTAEFSKLTENAYRDVNIAFANEIDLISKNYDIDTNELIRLANKHPRVSVLKPGIGVGGHCIPVDPWFIIKDNPEESKLIHQARQVNLEKTKYTVQLIEHKISQLSGKKIKVGFLGVTYKPNTDDIRESPALYIINKIKNKDIKKFIYDPYVKNISVFKFTSLEYLLNNCDIIFQLVDHKQFFEIDNSKYNIIKF